MPQKETAIKASAPIKTTLRRSKHAKKTKVKNAS